MDHAWEPHQFKNKRGMDAPVAGLLSPLNLPADGDILSSGLNGTAIRWRMRVLCRSRGHELCNKVSRIAQFPYKINYFCSGTYAYLMIMWLTNQHFGFPSTSAVFRKTRNFDVEIGLYD